MSGHTGNYRSWEQLQRAVIDRADRKDRPVAVQRFIHDRLLCRVFGGAAGDEWVLKGGTSMLARHGDTRSTRDIDLHRSDSSVDQAVDELARLAGIDLGDHIRYSLKDAKRTAETSTQPGRQAVKVRFDVHGGNRALGIVKLDVVVGAPPRSAPRVIEPATRVDVPGLETVPYALTPVADAIADKVCATLSSSYAGGASSRERDLVDLVIYAQTEKLNSIELHRAIQDEMRSRGLEGFDRFQVPAAWGPAYTKLAATVPHCADYPRVEEAETFVAKLIEPMLQPHPPASRWDGAGWERLPEPAARPFQVQVPGLQPRRAAGAPLSTGGQFDRKQAPGAAAQLV